MKRRFRVENHLLVENRPMLPGEQPFEVRLLPQAVTQLEIIPWMWINHTQASGRAVPMDQAWQYDTVRTDGIEAHLLGDMAGRGMQCMPFNIRADTSYKANRFYVEGVGWCGQCSIESQDAGSSTLNTTPWTPPQFEFMAQAEAAWAIEYKVPVQPVPNAYGQGISQHNAFSAWSKTAHSCPGTARTLQMPALRARIQQIIDEDALPDPTPTPAGGLMITVFMPDPAVPHTDVVAEFIAMVDDNGNALEVRWIATAEDVAVRDNHLAAGARVDHGDCTKGRFRNCDLRGPVPYGATYPWTADDFWHVNQ